MKTVRLLFSFRILVLLCAVHPVPAQSGVTTVHFRDYFPLTRQAHGIKTFKSTYGIPSVLRSCIGESDTMETGNGTHVTGTYVNGFTDIGDLLVADDGVGIQYLGNREAYLSSDAEAITLPLAFYFADLTNGTIRDLGVYYAIPRTNGVSAGDAEATTSLNILIDIQDVRIQNRVYTNAVIFWWLDEEYGYVEPAFGGKESELEIELPSSEDTSGWSLTDFDIFARGIGLIAFGGVDASENRLKRTYELVCPGVDDFNDSRRDNLLWGADVPDIGGASRIREMDQRLRFAGSSMAIAPWTCSYGSYEGDWEVTADVHLGDLLLTTNDSHAEVFLAVFNAADTNFIGPVRGGDHMVTSLDLYRDDGGGIERSFSCYLRTNGQSIAWAGGPMTTAREASFRFAFFAATKTLTAWYDGNGGGEGSSWTLLRAAKIDHPESDWGMGDDGLFRIALGFSCSDFTVDLSDQVWIDNFRISGALVPAPVLILRRMGDRVFLHLCGDDGREYAIEQTSSLGEEISWQTLTSFILGSGVPPPLEVSGAGALRRFYRAKLVP